MSATPGVQHHRITAAERPVRRWWMSKASSIERIAFHARLLRVQLEGHRWEHDSWTQRASLPFGDREGPCCNYLSDQVFASARCWNREEEGAPRARCAFDPDATAVSLNDALDDGEPKSRAATVSRSRLPEPVEQIRNILKGDAGAGI